MERSKIQEHFEGVETTKAYRGYSYSIGDALTLVILGSMCGLRNVSQIHQWAENDRIREFLKKHFGIEDTPCYCWLLCLLKMVKPESLNRCFIKWVKTLLTEDGREMTLSFDGKTICLLYLKVPEISTVSGTLSAVWKELSRFYAQQLLYYVASITYPAIRLPHQSPIQPPLCNPKSIAHLARARFTDVLINPPMAIRLPALTLMSSPWTSTERIVPLLKTLPQGFCSI